MTALLGLFFVAVAVWSAGFNWRTWRLRTLGILDADDAPRHSRH